MLYYVQVSIRKRAVFWHWGVHNWLSCLIKSYLKHQCREAGSCWVPSRMYDSFEGLLQRFQRKFVSHVQKHNKNHGSCFHGAPNTFKRNWLLLEWKCSRYDQALCPIGQNVRHLKRCKFLFFFLGGGGGEMSSNLSSVVFFQIWEICSVKSLSDSGAKKIPLQKKKKITV